MAASPLPESRHAAGPPAQPPHLSASTFRSLLGDGASVDDLLSLDASRRVSGWLSVPLSIFGIQRLAMLGFGCSMGHIAWSRPVGSPSLPGSVELA